MNPNQIKQLIEAGIPGAQAHVRGEDGRHFEAVVVAAAFTGLNTVKQHQLVYGALSGQMRDDAIHALSLRTLTPEQWAQAASGQRG